MAMVTKIPVLLDTDIGSDIDDAVALAYLLRNPRCELVGITTVTGDTSRRAAIAEVIVSRVGREDIPVHRGAEKVLLTGPGQPDVPHYEAIGAIPHRMNRPPDTALDFLRTTIRSRPGEITLLTIGPLTNVALLFATDPEIPSLLAGLVSMAGIYFTPGSREWNALVDPIASAMVFADGPAGHSCIGLDATRRCVMPADQVRRRFVEPPLDLVRDQAEVWFKGRDHIVFHDPLAASVIFRPQLCGFVDGEVAVRMVGDPSRWGETVFTEANGAAHRVAKEVDVGAFFDEFFSVFD